MYILKEYVEDSSIKTDKKINDDIYIENGILYIKNQYAEYQYYQHSYYVKVDNGNWVDLQGGIPVYFTEENLDKNICIEQEQA